MVLYMILLLLIYHEFVMTYDIDLNDSNMHALMNDIACEKTHKLGVLRSPST